MTTASPRPTPKPTAEVPNVAELRNVSKQFAGAIAVQNVSLVIPQGEFVAISGPSGSGKSTLLRMFEGIEQPDDGEVLLFGNSIADWKPKAIKKLIRERVGVGFQAPLLDTGLSAKNNISDTAAANNRKVSNERLVELAGHFGMLDKMLQQGGTLSGGEQVRVSMMRTMATKPDLLLLDEPTAALAGEGKTEAIAYLREAAEKDGTTVVMVTHDVSFAQPYIDREYVIENHQLVDQITY